MKKIISLFMTVTMILTVFSSCGGGSSITEEAAITKLDEAAKKTYETENIDVEQLIDMKTEVKDMGKTATETNFILKIKDFGTEKFIADNTIKFQSKLNDDEKSESMDRMVVADGYIYMYNRQNEKYMKAAESENPFPDRMEEIAPPLDLWKKGAMEDIKSKETKDGEVITYKLSTEKLKDDLLQVILGQLQFPPDMEVFFEIKEILGEVIIDKDGNITKDSVSLKGTLSESEEKKNEMPMNIEYGITILVNSVTNVEIEIPSDDSVVELPKNPSDIGNEPSTKGESGAEEKPVEDKK